MSRVVLSIRNSARAIKRVMVNETVASGGWRCVLVTVQPEKQNHFGCVCVCVRACECVCVCVKYTMYIIYKNLTSGK